jgi:hypothetical protein
MTDEVKDLSARVGLIEARMAKLEAYHEDNQRRLSGIETTTTASAAKLDLLLIQKARNDGAHGVFSQFWQVALAAISGGILGQAFRALWPDK